MSASFPARPAPPPVLPPVTASHMQWHHGAHTLEVLSLAAAGGGQPALQAQGSAYGLWVGGVQVTEANKDDVLGDRNEGATVKFAPATAGDNPTPPR